MNAKLTVLAAAVLAGFATSATADVFNGSPAKPGVYPLAAPLQALTPAAPLFRTEKAAFALIEGMLQELEGAIFEAGGCGLLKGTYPFSVSTSSDGSGSATLFGAAASSISLSSSLLADVSGRGDKYKVSGSGNTFNGLALPAFSGTAVYNVPGSIFLEDSEYTIGSVVRGINAYDGHVIKDFYRNTNFQPNDNLHPGGLTVIHDWGVQALTKQGYPVNKYWQRSTSWRSDGLPGETHWRKIRLVGSPCVITVGLDDFNNLDTAETFDESGSIGIVVPK